MLGAGPCCAPSMELMVDLKPRERFLSLVRGLSCARVDVPWLVVTSEKTGGAAKAPQKTESSFRAAGGTVNGGAGRGRHTLSVPLLMRRQKDCQTEQTETGVNT